MISLFERELLAMEREVRDLKSSYQRGLGTTRFYSATAQKSIASPMGFTSFNVLLEDGEPTPAAFVPAVSVPTPIGYSLSTFSLEDGGTRAVVAVGSLTPGTVKIKAFCSGVIEDIT